MWLFPMKWLFSQMKITSQQNREEAMILTPGVVPVSHKKPYRNREYNFELHKKADLKGKSWI